jgi:hypothetical protein
VPKGDKISIGGSVTGNAFIGDHNKTGDVVVASATTHDALRGEIRATLGAVRAEIAAKDDATPGKEIALEHVADLEKVVTSKDPDAAVANHLLGKLAKRLTGALAVSISLADLATKVSGLFG